MRGCLEVIGTAIYYSIWVSVRHVKAPRHLVRIHAIVRFVEPRYGQLGHEFHRTPRSVVRHHFLPIVAGHARSRVDGRHELFVFDQSPTLYCRPAKEMRSVMGPGKLNVE